MSASDLKHGLCISFPRKTFLIGEYAVLEKAPALLLNTRPRFYFYARLDEKSKDCLHPFHKESPAGAYIEKNKKWFYGIRISKSEDKEQYFGGFGSSSAEFNCVYLIKKILEDVSYKSIDLFQLWKDYKELNNHFSGADVLSQWAGGLSFVSYEPFKAESSSWVFKNLDFILIHTKERLRTWEHVKGLHQNFSVLKQITCNILSDKKYVDEDSFLSAVQEYAKELLSQGLVSPLTQSILKKYEHRPEVLAAKGCGALGAGPILFIVKKGQSTSFLKDENIIVSSKDIDLQGARLEIIP